ncbi:MAG: iron-containing alcohol dehydrogenase [Candidatus Sulfobium sp.]
MNFEFQNPTHLIFGGGVLNRLGEVVSAHGKHALLVTGGGSVKKTGVLDRAIDSLKSAGVSVAECPGVEPNPRISSVRRGADIARKEKSDVIIALGGGSTMDASKVMAAAVFYDGDPWDMILHGQPDQYVPAQALPIITVPTLAATGSEMNCGAVISNEETSEKSFVTAPCLYPHTALVDPELTVTVPVDQTAYGICDIITHLTEYYFNGIDGTPLQDRSAEGVILTTMEYGKKALADGEDIEARTQIQLASILALNGWVNSGVAGSAPVHFIEHTISAHHDVTHGAGLAVVNPAWMRFAARRRPDKFVQFAERIFGLKANGAGEMDTAMTGIDRFEDFLHSIACPTKLSDLGIDDKQIPRYAEDTVRIIHDENGMLPGRPPMSATDIETVLHAAL